MDDTLLGGDMNEASLGGGNDNPFVLGGGTNEALLREGNDNTFIK